jgi:aryl carrier-like protein
MNKKLDEQHLLLIQQLRDEFAENSNIIGNNSIRMIMLQKEIDKLNMTQDTAIAEFEALQIKESELLETLRERYGEGQVNINEGTFTPGTGLVE